MERAIHMLPCPFCGGEAAFHWESGDERNAYARSAKVSCTKCHASSGWVSGDTSKPGYADNSTVDVRALQAWNTRNSAGFGLESAARAAIPFIAYAFAHGVDGAEQAGRAIEAALAAHPEVP